MISGSFSNLKGLTSNNHNTEKYQEISRRLQQVSLPSVNSRNLIPLCEDWEKKSSLFSFCASECPLELVFIGVNVVISDLESLWFSSRAGDD